LSRKTVTLEVCPASLQQEWMILDNDQPVLRGPGVEVVRAFSIMSGVKGGTFQPPSAEELARWRRKWNGPLILVRVISRVEKPGSLRSQPAPSLIPKPQTEDGFD
jgi:hypothetical protein